MKRTIKGKIALIIPAYNESLVISHTIQSAIAAGMSPCHIFVVDDSSSDDTAAIARSLVGTENVLTVDRSGKGLAIRKIVEAFKLTTHYRWIHIADADGEFDSRYFTELRKKLRVSHAAATGYVANLDGGYISRYRSFEYAVGMDIIRRFQAIFGVITIIPGPTSLFRNDIFEQLNFNDHALCEDFDVTMQIHRKKLGTIQFIPSAITRTQDPATYKDFIKQITRWNRGVLQMFFKHRIGTKASKVDIYLSYQILQNLLFAAMFGVWVPFVTIVSDSLSYAALVVLSDIIITLGLVLFAVGRVGRWGILGAFPIVYALRWVSLVVFLRCFVEVVILKRYRHAQGLWETVARRTQETVS